MKYKIIHHKVFKVYFDGKVEYSKETVIRETNSIKKALLMAYKAHDENVGHEVIGKDNFSVFDDKDNVVCSFGYRITKVIFRDKEVER